MVESGDSRSSVINDANNLDQDNIVINAQQWQEITERIEMLEKESESGKASTHDGIRCDGCYPGNNIGSKDIVGVRFKCLDCENLGLCSSCEKKGVETAGHKVSHNMAMIKKPIGCFWCFYSSKSHLVFFRAISGVLHILPLVAGWLTIIILVNSIFSSLG